MRTKISTQSKIPKTWAGLTKLHPLRPIRDDVGLRNALEIVDALALLERRTKDQEDYLDSLATLVESYEDQSFAIDPSLVTPIQMLEFLMEQHEMSGSDLGRILGQRTLGSARPRRGAGRRGRGLGQCGGGPSLCGARQRR